MPYAIRLPDGTLVDNIPDEITPEQAKQRIIAKYPEFAPKQAQPERSNILDELGRGAKQLLSTSQTGIEALGADPAQAAIRGIGRGKEIDAQYGAAPSWEGVKQAYEESGILGAAGRVATDLPRVLAGQVPQLGAMGAGALTGARLGALAGPAGAGVGAALGAGATLLPQFFGANIERQAQEQQEAGQPINIDRTAAGAAAVGQAGIEAAGTAFVLGKNLVKSLLKIGSDDALKSVAARGALTNLATGAVRGAATELPVEVAQQVLERAQAGQDVLSDDALQEYGDLTYQTILAGAGMGGAGNVVARSRGAAAQETGGEAPIDIARRKAEEAAAAKAAAQPSQPSQFLTSEQLSQLATSEAGYGQLEQYKQRLLQQPKSKERTDALKEVQALQRQMNVEMAKRITPAAPRESAFADIPQAELFDDKLYVPEQEQEQETDVAPEATSEPQPGQMELPFEGEGGQQALFPEIGYDAQPAPYTERLITEKELQFVGIDPKSKKGSALLGKPFGELPESAVVVDNAMLDRAGINPRSPVRKRLIGKRLDRPSQLKYVRDEIEAYATKYAKPEQYPALTEFLTNIDTLNAKQEELPISPPRVRKKGERLVAQPQPQPVDTAGAAGTVAPVSPTPSVPSVGVVSEPVGVGATTAPDAAGVDIFEPVTPVDDGRAGKESAALKPAPTAQQQADDLYTQIKAAEAKRDALLTKNGRKPAAKTKARAEWDRLGEEIESLKLKSMAADDAARAASTAPAPEATPAPEPLRMPAQPRAIKPAPTGAGFTGIEDRVAQATAQWSVTRLEDRIRDVNQELKDARAVQKNMESRGGEYLQDNAPEYEQVGTQATNLEAELKALKSELAKARKTAGTTKRAQGRPTAEQQPALSTFPDNPPSLKKQIQEVIEAVGAYNNPSSDSVRRKLATDYIFDLVKDADRPRGQRLFPEYQKAAHDFAKRALKYAIDPADLTGPQKREYDALTKDVEDDDTPWGGYLYQPDTHVLNTSRQRQLDIEVELLTRRSAQQVADWVANTAPNREMRLIATKVAARMKAMEQAGFEFRFSVRNDLKSLGRVKFGQKDGAEIIDIAIRGTAGSPRSGANYETILHELLHAVTATAIHSKKNAALTQRLDEVLAAVKASIKAGNTKELSNAFDNVDEMLAWAFTNPQAQATLEAIPYKKQSAWSRLVDTIRAFLGLAAKQNTALSEILSVGEQILDADVANDIVITQEFTADQVDFVADREDPSFTKQILNQLGGKPGAGLRVKLTDQLAAIDDIFTWAYDGKVRDAQGNISPIVGMSRALNADRFSNAVQKFGGFVKKNGLWQADELVAAPNFTAIAGEKVSYAKALDEIVRAAKAKGVAFDVEAKRIGNLMVGRRYHELHQAQARGENDFNLSAISPEKAAQANAEFLADPLAVRVQQMLDAVRFNLVDAMEQAGRIAPETSQSWKDASGYVPFDRLKPEEVDVVVSSRGVNRGLAALKNLKPFKGDDNQVVNPIEQFSRLIDWMVSETMKNEASLKALTEMEMLGKGFAESVAHPNAAPNSKAVITVREAGKPKHFYVPDPSHFVAFSLMPSQVSSVIRAFQKLSQVLRAGVTTAPPFVIKQVFDDIYRIYAYSELKHPTAAVGRILMNLPKNWFNEAFRRNSSYVKGMEKIGIVGSFDFSEVGNLKNIMEEVGARKRGLGGQMLHFMEAGAKAQDFTVRKAIYDQALKETNDPVFAESQAREIINFSRRGSAKMMDYLIRTIPFFNAYARGMDKLWVAASGGRGGKVTGQARAAFWQRMSVLTAIGTMYALMMQDDEEYNKLDDHIRDRNWVLPFGKELGFTPVMPVPNELAFIFKAIPERVVQYIRLSGTPEERDALRILGEIAKQGIDIMATPNLNPQALRWIVENVANYSFFLGRPLESQAQIANYAPFERYGMGTSETSKAITQWMANNGMEWLSPIKLDNALRSLLGTVGGVALEISDSLINPTRTDRPLHQRLGSQLTGASALMKDPVGSRYIAMLYDLDRKTTQVLGTYKRKAEKDPEDAAQYLDKHYGMYAIQPQVQALVNQLQKLNAEARAIDKMADTLTPAERREALDLVKLEQQEIARQVLMLETQAMQITAEVARQ